jgi:hypothetical protein
MPVLCDLLCLRQFPQPHLERIPIRSRQPLQLRNRQPFVFPQLRLKFDREIRVMMATKMKQEIAAFVLRFP